MLTFKQFILEGGNYKSAQSINLKEIKRSIVKDSIESFLQELNSNLNIWYSKTLEKKLMLSGSTALLFNQNVSDEDLIKFHPIIGDIDTMVDLNKESQILKNLKSLPNYKLISFKKTSGQIITLWKIKISDKEYDLQLDLELVEYKDSKPTDWSTFAHSSTPEDLVKGIKGVWSKLLIRAISAKDGLPNKLAFSVSRGLRNKFDSDGKLLSTSDSEYITDINKILQMLFGVNKDFNSIEIKAASSFVGLINLIKKYVKTNEEIKNIYDAFLYSLYSEKGLKLYKTDPARDKEEKQLAVDYLKSNLKIKE